MQTDRAGIVVLIGENTNVKRYRDGSTNLVIIWRCSYSSMFFGFWSIPENTYYRPISKIGNYPKKFTEKRDSDKHYRIILPVEKLVCKFVCILLDISNWIIINVWFGKGLKIHFVHVLTRAWLLNVLCISWTWSKIWHIFCFIITYETCMTYMFIFP